MTSPAALHTAQCDRRLGPRVDIAALVGPVGWSRLSPQIRHRFSHSEARRVYDGALDLSCSRIGRWFAWCAAAFGGPLIGIEGRAVAAEVRVWSDGRGGVVWERHLRTPRGEQIVRSTKELGARGKLVEHTDGGLAMELEVFEGGGALVFESRRYFFALGSWQIPVPRALTPGVCRVEHRDEGPGLFRFTLTMRHRWWGTTFHQTGIFADPREDHL